MLLLVPPIIVFSATTASAGWPCGSRESQFTGYRGFLTPPQSWDETPIGVSSYLVARGTQVCGSPYSSSVWVAISNLNDNSQYLQSGYLTISSGCTLVFTEYRLGGMGVPYRSYPLGANCVSGGDWGAFRVRYHGPMGPYADDGSGYMSLEVPGGTTYLAGSPWRWGWSTTMVFSSETDNVTNDIPGRDVAHTSWWAMGIQSVETGALRAIPCYLMVVRQGSQQGRYAMQPSGCESFDTWTSNKLQGAG